MKSNYRKQPYRTLHTYISESTNVKAYNVRVYRVPYVINGNYSISATLYTLKVRFDTYIVASTLHQSAKIITMIII